MKLELLSFTDQGEALARRLAKALGGTALRCGQPESLDQWTRRAFSNAEGLIFVGAAGIAVRAIAPYLKHKIQDPAVVVVDETGHFAIPILSGHLGGANDLARQIARAIGAEPVITTATDCNEVFSVDQWARRHNCALRNPERIKAVSGRLLSGEQVTYSTDFPLSGQVPEGLRPVPTGGEICLSLFRQAEGCLHLIPRLVTLGVGCRKGISRQTLEVALTGFLQETGLSMESITAAATIDLKGEEPGLLAFCQAHGWPLSYYSAGALSAVPGRFSASPFVAQVTGVDNVCQRAAVCHSGGELLTGKYAANGVTLAAAAAPWAPDWS